MADNLIDSDPHEILEKLLDEFEKYKNGETNSYNDTYKKVRKWCKNYKWGFHKDKITNPIIEKIVKKIADDDEILEELLETGYDPHSKSEKEVEDLIKRIGIPDLKDALENILGNIDYLDYLPKDDSN